MSTDKSSSNKFYHNSFINNTSQANATSNCVDIWDNGFTSGGNYWSDYAGEDAYSGIFQNETCRDGIGDTTYLVDEDNRDRYPLVDPWSTHLNPPVARFTHSPTLPSAREETTFNASSSYDLDEDITSYRWSFGDDNTTSTINSKITHTYSLPGIYNATLTVIDGRGFNSSYSQIVWVRMITFVSISTSSRSTFVGYEVNVTGTLHDMFGNGLNNETVVLRYTFGGIGTWTPITSDTTDSLGNYHAVWIPPATGSFLIKAEWVGNLTYVGIHNVTCLDTLSYVDEYVFSVESNSTVSSLSFNPNNMKLSFTVSGSLGTQGYVRITFAKSLVDDIEDVKVYLNNEQIDYTATSLDDSWLLHFTYMHSTHEITISLGDISTPFTQTLLGWAIICLVPVMAVVALALVYVMRRKRANR